jgi:squalene-hopene/tetraprenyl-beta-curcumene cyclase
MDLETENRWRNAPRRRFVRCAEDAFDAGLARIETELCAASMSRMRTTIASIVVALSVLSIQSPTHASLQAPQAATPQAKSVEPQAKSVEVDVKPDIDGALRWMRSQQEAKDGSYASSVETTAWVLRSMVDSPRRYVRADGPFVARALDYLVSKQATDGSIHDANAPKEKIAEQTRLAAAALTLHADEATKPAIAKALAYIGQDPASKEKPGPGWGDEALPESKEELRTRVDAILKARGADGSWDGAGGKILVTAKNSVYLSRAASKLAPKAAPAATSAKPLPAFEPSDRAKTLAALESGAKFLAGAGPDGKFGAPGKPDAGTTAMAIGALLAVPEPRAKEIQSCIDKGLAWIVSLQRPDGAIHDGKLANYVTSASIMTLARADRDEYKPVIAKARDFLVSLQADESEGYSEDQFFYGGIGYGSSERPDLSNLQMALEALSASGLEKGNDAFKRALKFLERCQNRSESNDIQIAEGSGVIQSGDDGGAGYLPGQSYAGYIELGNGVKVPRSYGSMSYALLKAYIFVGLPKEDPRMQAVWDWVRKNYTLDLNPGFESSPDPTAAYQGLFYYFHTMAKALDLYGEEEIVDAQGKKHAWRKELAGRLVAMQRKQDGAWINENNGRWWESNPVIATSYALLALGEALPGGGN